MNVSYYKSAIDNEGTIAGLMPILNGIKSGHWANQINELRGLSKEEYDLNKKYLPAATFSGTFAPSRHDKNIQSYTGVITIDLDHIGESLSVTKDKLRKHPHVLSCFTSPSNDGLKILVLTDTSSDKHGESFDYLKKDIKKHLGIELDASGRNLSRLCFVSYDPDIHINTEATPMPIAKELAKVKPPAKRDVKVNSDNQRIITAERVTRARHQFIKGSRNAYIHYLCCCMNRLGVTKEEGYDYAVNTYSSRDFPESEFKATIHSSYKNLNEFGKWTLETITKAPEVKYERSYKASFVGESIYDILMLMVDKDDMGNGPKSFVPDVDDALGGCMERGNLYGVIGRDGTYKSIMAMMMAVENAKEGRGAIYFNMEMSRVQMLSRIFIRENNINIIKEKREGRLNNDTARSLTDNLKMINENLIIVSDSNIAFSSMAEGIRKIISSKPAFDLQLVIIDGISSMADEKNQGEVFAAIEASMNLKELAKELNVVILVLAHTRTDAPKHIRNTGPFVRGGIKITGNMDGYFCHSLLIDPITNESMGEDIIYRDGIFYMRFIDKRGAASEINKVIAINNNIQIDITDMNPAEQEIKLKR